MQNIDSPLKRGQTQRGTSARRTQHHAVLRLVMLMACMLLPAGCQKHLRKDIPLVALQAQDRSSDFADMFCALLSTEKRPDGRAWAKCSTWLDGAKPHPSTISPSIDSAYRLLLIAGFGSDCMTGPHSTFMDSIAHLQSVHNFKAETFPVSAFGSAEFNAKQIANYLDGQFTADQRKYIVLGYSKGLADLQVAIADQPGVRDKVAALVTLSGVVQGSRLSELPNVNAQVFPQTDLTACTPGDMGGLASMSPRARKAFLARHPDPLVPTYSVAAYSKRSNTSNILLPFWDLISEYGQVEDSQMIAAEAIYPKSAYLGLLTRDHWAIAIPFETSPVVNKTDFPRVQLFEAILRFVIADLKTRGPHNP